VDEFGSADKGSGIRVQGSGFEVQGSRFRVQGSGFRVQGSRFRVQPGRWPEKRPVKSKKKLLRIVGRASVPARFGLT